MLAPARAHPHMPRRRKSISPYRASTGNASPRAALRRVSYCVTTVDRSAGSPFGLIIAEFFPSNGPLDRPGMYVQIEFLSNERGEFARPHRFTCDQLLFNERQCLALKFMRATWTALSGH